MLKIFRFFLPPTVITLEPAEPRPIPPSADEIQRATYELVRERVLDALGPQGTFAVTMRRGDEADEFFSEALAESIARDISRSLRSGSAAMRAVPRSAPALSAPRDDRAIEAPSAEEPPRELAQQPHHIAA